MREWLLSAICVAEVCKTFTLEPSGVQFPPLSPWPISEVVYHASLSKKYHGFESRMGRCYAADGVSLLGGCSIMVLSSSGEDITLSQ